MNSNVVKSKILIWKGSGRAQHASFTIDKKFENTLATSITTAAEYKQERTRNQNAEKILKSLSSRGFSVKEELPKYDFDDLVGLIGEMVLEEFVRRNGSELLFAKWKVSGTSKSRGIDLVARKFSKQWTLTLFEAKHLHVAVKGKPKDRCYPEISSRFRNGLAEFEREVTVFNLSNILAKISYSIRHGRALGSEDTNLTLIRDFLSSRLRNEDYSLEVVTCIDSRYCEDVTLGKSTEHVDRPAGIGSHDTCLTLLEAERLEELSDQIGEEHVQA